MTDEPSEVQPIDPDRTNRPPRCRAGADWRRRRCRGRAEGSQGRHRLFGELVSEPSARRSKDTIQAPIEGTFRQSIRIGDLLSTAYTLLAALGIAPEYMRLLRCLLGAGGGMSFSFDACAALGEMIGGEGSMTRTSQIPTTMETLWHRDPKTTDMTMDEETIAAFETYYQQVQESQAITASAAEGQDMLGMIDTGNA